MEEIYIVKVRDFEHGFDHVHWTGEHGIKNLSIDNLLVHQKKKL